MFSNLQGHHFRKTTSRLLIEIPKGQAITAVFNKGEANETNGLIQGFWAATANGRRCGMCYSSSQMRHCSSYVVRGKCWGRGGEGKGRQQEFGVGREGKGLGRERWDRS